MFVTQVDSILDYVIYCRHLLGLILPEWMILLRGRSPPHQKAWRLRAILVDPSIAHKSIYISFAHIRYGTFKY